MDLGLNVNSKITSASSKLCASPQNIAFAGTVSYRKNTYFRVK